MNKGKVLGVLAATGALCLTVAQLSGAQEEIRVERISSRQAAVSHAYAFVRGGGLRVNGQVSRWHELHVPGHVDVLIYDPEGALLGAARERLPGIMSQRKGRQNFSFSSRFDFIPPPGSTVRVRYHWLPSFLAGAEGR